MRKDPHSRRAADVTASVLVALGQLTHSADNVDIFHGVGGVYPVASPPRCRTLWVSAIVGSIFIAKEGWRSVNRAMIFAVKDALLVAHQGALPVRGRGEQLTICERA